MELNNRLEDLKAASNQAAAHHNSLIGRHQEVEEMTHNFPDLQDKLSERVKELQALISESLQNFNAIIGRIQECEFLMNNKNKDNECIDVEAQPE